MITSFSLLTRNSCLALLLRPIDRDDEFALGVAVKIAAGRVDIAIKAVCINDCNTDRRLLDDLFEQPGQAVLRAFGAAFRQLRLRLV